MRALWGALAIVLGCAGDLPLPRVVAVAPDSMQASDAREVTVRFEGILPYVVDYGAASGTVATSVNVSIGEVTVGSGAYRSDGSVIVLVPSVLSPGTHDVTVTLADGRAATGAAFFQVEPGDWPSGYGVEPIADHALGDAFELRVEALRGNGRYATFRGTVGLSLQGTEGQVSPPRTQPFTAGQVTERMVMVTSPGDHVLVIRDANGTTAVSNTFRVTPP